MRARGYEVEVLERRPVLGGKMHRVSHNGFHFDAGPSFLTQPHRIAALFTLFGEQIEDPLPITPVDPSVHYWWPDGTRVTTPRDRDALVAELTTLGAPASRIRDYLDEIARQYDTVAAPFVDSSITRPSFWLHPQTLLRLTGSFGMLGRTFASFNRSWFPDNPRIVQLLNRFATYAGNDPYRAPAFMTSIADVELRQGIFYPEDGLRSVPEALVALGKRHGIRYRTDVEVTGLRRDGARVTAVETVNGPVEADLVISAIDPQHVAPWLGRERSSVPRALSALIWFLGVDAVDGVGLHNIFFADDYFAEFAHLAAHDIGDDLTIYVNVSSVESPSHAPTGKQNWFVMINAPADHGQDWDALRDRLRPVVVDKLSRCLGQDLVVHGETTYAPPDIARTSGAFQGAIYGPAGNRLIDLFRKQPAVDRELTNLYYCGGSSHPGGGIPMCLASAELATDAIKAREPS
jgi:phytoene desaturase